MEKNILVSFKGWNKKVTFYSSPFESDGSLIHRKITEMLYSDTTLQHLLGRKEFLLQQYDQTVDAMINIDDEPILDRAKVCISLIGGSDSNQKPLEMQQPSYSNYTSFQSNSMPPADNYSEPMHQAKTNGTKLPRLPDGEERTNLIINYLPQHMSDEELTAMFVTVGPLERAKIIRDNRTKYSFGFGFVEYTSPLDAHRAIHQLNGLQVLHKQIKVSYARPSGDDIKGTNLYITNLPRTITTEGLNNMFSRFGTIVQAYLPKDKTTGLHKGNGFVRFDKKEQAEAALSEMNGFTPAGGYESINVKMAEDRGRKNQAQYTVGGGYGGRGSGYQMRPRFMRPMGMGPPGMRPHFGPSGAMRSVRPTNRYNPMRGPSHMY